MLKKFNSSDFFRIKNFIISNSVQPNCDRCSLLAYKDIVITLCCNERTHTVCICEGVNNTYDYNDIFTDLLELSKNSDYINKKYIFFYNSEIECETECCDLNKCFVK